MGLVRHSETLEELVLYETMYENEHGRTWVRPKEMFFEKIKKNNHDGFRFEPIAFEFKNSESCTDLEIGILKDLIQQTLVNFDETKFTDRLRAQKILLQIAYENQKPVGFKLGYALNQEIFYSWMEAVLPEYRGVGLGSVFMKSQHAWCLEKGFKKIQTKSENQFKQMIRLNLNFGFEIVGTESNKLNKVKILFEKSLS